jgi:hypothetical protein
MFLHSDRRAFGVRMDFTIIFQTFKQLEYPARCTASEADHGTENGGWMTEERGNRKAAGLK